MRQLSVKILLLLLFVSPKILCAQIHKPVYSLWSSTAAKTKFSLRIDHKICVENISEKIGISLWAYQLKSICSDPKKCALEIFVDDKCTKNLIATGETNITNGKSTVKMTQRKYYVYVSDYYILIMDAL